MTVDVKTLPLHAIPRGKVGVFRVSENSYNRCLGEVTGVQASTVLGLVVVETIKEGGGDSSSSFMVRMFMYSTYMVTFHVSKHISMTNHAGCVLTDNRGQQEVSKRSAGGQN